MTAYYNEIDPFAAQWLRNLIAGGQIVSGIVDERSIEDVTPDDLRGFKQVHLFAGAGGWSYALRLAGWPDSRPVWTCSCPCQPFSASGKGAGFDDERHLWPAAHWLIEKRDPVIVFGEQAAGGRANIWFDLVQADMEGMGYTFGIVPFPAAAVGASDIRERAYWVADTYVQHQSTTGDSPGFADCGRRWPPHRVGKAGLRSGAAEVNGFWRNADWLLSRDEQWRPVEPGTSPMVNGPAARVGRVQPDVSRMAARNRAGRIRGYGNSLNVRAAAAFVRAYMECRP